MTHEIRDRFNQHQGEGPRPQWPTRSDGPIDPHELELPDHAGQKLWLNVFRGMLSRWRQGRLALRVEHNGQPVGPHEVAWSKLWPHSRTDARGKQFRPYRCAPDFTAAQWEALTWLAARWGVLRPEALRRCLDDTAAREMHDALQERAATSPPESPARARRAGTGGRTPARSRR